MAHGLTPKQERFCVEYFKCGNASEAYRIAYDAENMTPGSISVRASELLDNSKIAVRLDGLKSQVAKKAIVTKEKAIEVLTEIMFNADRDSDRIKAVNQIGDFLGWKAPIRTNQTVDILSPWEKYCQSHNEETENGD